MGSRPSTHIAPTATFKQASRRQQGTDPQQAGLGGAVTRAGNVHRPPALALVLCPKQRYPWATVAHRGARGTLDEFKAAWVGRRAHHGDTPQILPGNLPPAAIAHWRIGLQPYPPSRRGWLIGNLT
jgi:hypothetical protein